VSPLRATAFALVSAAALLAGAQAQADPTLKQRALKQKKQAATQKWPAALKDRVSRYAHMKRVDDRSGDFREQVKSRLVRERVDDPRGDRYERWKHELVRKAGEKPSARRYANLRRLRDPGADVSERRLARLSVTRRHADLRRHKLITSKSGLEGVGTEVQELARWKRDLLRFGDPRRVERTAIADEQARAGRLRSRADANARRRERIKRRDEEGDSPYLNTREDHRDEARQELQDNKALAREEAKAEREGEKDSARDEAQAERDSEKQSAREEAKLEREGERDAAREEKDAERDQEAGDRSSERDLERQDDRALDRTQQLEEDND